MDSNQVLSIYTQLENLILLIQISSHEVPNLNHTSLGFPPCAVLCYVVDVVCDVTENERVTI